MLMKVFNTPGYHGYNVKFSSFLPNSLACAASCNFGIQGAGALYVIDDVLSRNASIIKRGEWTDGLFDITWSECVPHTVVTGSGDSTIQIWNILNSQDPISVLSGHAKEISSVDWSQTRVNQHLLSGSWDATIRTWDCEAGKSLSTFAGHKQKIYTAAWSPLIPYCFASASGDGLVCVWNSQCNSHPGLIIPTGSGEVLSCAWNYYEKDILATVGVDNFIKGWDLRKATVPLFQLLGHSYAVRKIKFSPHMKDILATVSYDFTTRIWDYTQENEVELFQHHSEFVSGLDFNAQVTGLMADCGWDSRIQIFAWPCLDQSL